MKTKTKPTNPHTWFFAHLKTVDGWGQGFDDVIKESIISDYSGGKTESLKELYDKYPKAYHRMRKDLSPQSKKVINERYDDARKRLIAAIFSHLEDKGYKPDMDYVKRVACKGGKTKRFNDIPLPTLKDLYNRFKNKDLQAQVNDLIKDI